MPQLPCRWDTFSSAAQMCDIKKKNNKAETSTRHLPAWVMIIIINSSSNDYYYHYLVPL